MFHQRDDRRHDRPAAPVIEAVFVAPRICPFCSCGNLSSNGRATAETYYRCNKCGQVWNPRRLRG